MEDVIDAGHDIVATSPEERGLHLLDPEQIPWTPPAVRPVQGREPVLPRDDDRPLDPNGVWEKSLVYPLPGEDRFPISIVRFPPNFAFPRHWHTDGELICVRGGTMNLAGAPSGTGTMAYNDARTVYGAEAAGEDGCEFLMIRRAWSQTTIVQSPADVPDDVLDTGEEILAVSRAERGLHVFDLDAIPWTNPVRRPVQGNAPLLPEDDDRPVDPDGVWEKSLMYPLPGDDRFPISIIRFPPNFSFARHWHTDGEFVLLLSGTANFAGHEIGPGAMAYNDARTVYGAEAAGPEGCEFLMVRRAWAETHIVGPAAA
jgi:quercetin dioxygenase-like cupin family protein